MMWLSMWKFAWDFEFKNAWTILGECCNDFCTWDTCDFGTWFLFTNPHINNHITCFFSKTIFRVILSDGHCFLDPAMKYQSIGTRKKLYGLEKSLKFVLSKELLYYYSITIVFQYADSKKFTRTLRTPLFYVFHEKIRQTLFISLHATMDNFLQKIHYLIY